MRIGAIGAGIAGLAAGIGLRRAGADVTVFERRPDTEPTGSGLSLFGNARRALVALGVGEELEAISTAAVTVLRGGQRRPDGGWLATTPPEAIRALRIVHRSDLHRLLRESLGSGSLRTDTSVRVLDDDGGVELSSGSEVERDGFDVVVAADGIFSRTRRGWPGDPGTRYSGYSTWRGITSTPVPLDAAGETWGRGLRFGMAPLTDGRVYWFAVATMPADERLENEHLEVLRLFGGWHSPIPALIESTAPEAVFRLPISDLGGRLPSFRRGRTVLLGDAAHAMTPDLGQGAGQALEDAATLAALLRPVAAAPSSDPAAIHDALDRYDELRRPRTQELARRARLLGQVAQGQTALPTWLRDALIRATPPAALAAQLRRIQSWEPPQTVAPVP